MSAKKCACEYERILKPAGMEVRIFTELGRYITGPFGYLVTRAIHKKGNA